MKCLWGGAVRARPEIRRMLSGIRQTAACMTRSRLIHLPLFRALRPDCSGRDPDRPRDMLLARVPARTLIACSGCMYVVVQMKTFERDMQSRNHVRHRPGPAQTPLTRLSAGVEQKSRPGGWLCTIRVAADRPPAEPRWPPPLRPARATFARPARSIPSHLHRNVRDPSGSGSGASMAWGWRVWKRCGGGTPDDL